eukprot:210592_1
MFAMPVLHTEQLASSSACLSRCACEQSARNAIVFWLFVQYRSITILIFQITNDVSRYTYNDLQNEFNIALRMVRFTYHVVKTYTTYHMICSGVHHSRPNRQSKYSRTNHSYMTEPTTEPTAATRNPTTADPTFDEGRVHDATSQTTPEESEKFVGSEKGPLFTAFAEAVVIVCVAVAVLVVIITCKWKKGNGLSKAAQDGIMMSDDTTSNYNQTATTSKRCIVTATVACEYENTEQDIDDENTEQDIDDENTEQDIDDENDTEDEDADELYVVHDDGEKENHLM